MNALGYEFESPDLVWRLLLLTNYQASLVQIVCEALVKELSRRDLPEGAAAYTSPAATSSRSMPSARSGT
ncbi:MAG: hypothetical protein ACRDP7_06540 [Trebonia sp.]